MRISERRLKLYLSGYIDLKQEEKDFFNEIISKFENVLKDIKVSVCNYLEMESDTAFGEKTKNYINSIEEKIIYIKDCNSNNMKNVFIVDRSICDITGDILRENDMVNVFFYNYLFRKIMNNDIIDVYRKPL